jgi:hypothetical protein
MNKIFNRACGLDEVNRACGLDEVNRACGLDEVNRGAEEPRSRGAKALGDKFREAEAATSSTKSTMWVLPINRNDFPFHGTSCPASGGRLSGH